MEAHLLDLVARYGYAVVLFGVGIESMGIPVPGETVLLIGVVVASQGHLALAGVVLAGWVGAVVGDNLGYLVGRRWGQQLMTAPGLSRLYRPERIDAAERLMERFGFLAVFGGRFVALLRIFAGPLAGMHGMRWRTFVAANALGAALWVGAVAAVGTLLGDNLSAATRFLSRSGYIGLALAACAVAALVVWHRRKRPGHVEDEEHA